MAYERRRRGFERAGKVSLERLGLSKSRARELVVTEAWNRVAGPALASHTRAVRVRRGLLEVEIDDGPWAATFAELMPRLAGRLAADRPELMVRKYQAVLAGEPPAGPARTVVPAHEAEPETSPKPAPPRTATPDRSLEERLPEVARHYLARRKS